MNSLAIRLSLFAGAALLWATPAFPQGWQHLGNVEAIRKRPDGVELTSGSAKVRITAVRDGVIRVRVVPRGEFPKDASWAVIEKPEPQTISIEESQDNIRIRAGSVSVIVSKSPLLIRFADAKGDAILEDERSLPMAWNGSRFRIWKKMPLSEHYYGLGDKAGPIDRRNRAFSMWNTDTPGWQESTDPLYKSIPFFIGLKNGVAYGIFLDNTYRTSFDFGTESPDYYSFGAEGGVLDYYYIAGPDPKAVIESYTALVGRIPLPPLWSLGYQQSRWGYYPEKRVREIANTLREKKIPADTIYLDIDYQQDFAPFTVNRDYFPDFEKMIQDLKEQKFHLVLITDLHIKYAPNSGYGPFDSGIKADVFVKKADGSLYVAPVWPGDSVFPDFTLSRVRDWWGGLYKNFSDMGVTGFWNDMDEPSVFQTPDKTMPLDNLHRLDDGTTIQHRAVHNVYGMLNSRATFEGLLQLNPDERPFVLTRASYAGGQRYAATWTGDNVATWNHLAMSTSGLLSLGISGFALVGDDIGGFGSTPPADLLTRWFQVGAFNPIYRNHSSKGTGDHEPWVNGEEQEVIRRKFIERRYRLMPYIYTQVESSTRTGLPIMSPVFLQFPKLESFWNDDRDFFFGEAFFVSPVVTESIDAHRVQLPPGGWYDYWTGERFADQESLSLHPKLDELPVFVRAGSIIPEQPLVQSTLEQPSGPLELQVYPGPDCHGSLYQDDGHSRAYLRGEFLRMTFSCDENSQGIRISSHVEKNAYKPWWDSMEIRVFGVQRKPTGINVGAEKLSDWRFDAQTKSVSMVLQRGPGNWALQILY
jgi:alpha-glucosidase